MPLDNSNNSLNKVILNELRVSYYIQTIKKTSKKRGILALYFNETVQVILNKIFGAGAGLDVCISETKDYRSITVKPRTTASKGRAVHICRDGPHGFSIRKAFPYSRHYRTHCSLLARSIRLSDSGLKIRTKPKDDWLKVGEGAHHQNDRKKDEELPLFDTPLHMIIRIDDIEPGYSIRFRKRIEREAQVRGIDVRGSTRIFHTNFGEVSEQDIIAAGTLHPIAPR